MAIGRELLRPLSPPIDRAARDRTNGERGGTHGDIGTGLICIGEIVGY